MSIVSITIEQIIILMLLVLLGVYLSKNKTIDERTSKVMSKILVDIITPCLIINNLQIESSKERIKGMLVVFGISFLIYVIGAIIVKFIYKKTEDYDYKVARFMSMYANCGYMGFPLVSGILGEKGAFYCVAPIAIVNLFAFTHGVILMKKEGEKFNPKRLLSPALSSVFIGMILHVLQIKLPRIILTPINLMSALNTPIAMLVAGYNIYKVDFRKLKNKLRLLEIISIKNLVIPIIVAFAMSVIDIPVMQKLVTVIMSACPSATLGVILSVQYNRDSEFAATTFALSTILIVVTLPIVVYITNLLGMSI